MRPRTLDEYVGQEPLVGPGKPLRTQIERDDPGSLIFWGPPGTGKTSLPDEIITQILDAAIRAPSAGNSQHWAFVVVRDPESRAAAVESVAAAAEGIVVTVCGTGAATTNQTNSSALRPCASATRSFFTARNTLCLAAPG